MAKSRRKRKFDCGHRGQGKKCQRCKQADALLHELSSNIKLTRFDRRKLMIRAAQLRAVSNVTVQHLIDVGFSREEAFAISLGYGQN